MLTAEQNERLTHVGPGTPMGELMRRYWHPIAGSAQLNEENPTREVRLLGEDLVLFRSTVGELGQIEPSCPHRKANMSYGVPEPEGIRCAYHGWLYDTAGNCIDQPSEPAGSRFKDKVHLTAYPTVEQGGVIWTYMGPTELQPPPPLFAWTQVADTHRHVTKVIQECNWLQALEGGIDTSHAQILHRNFQDGIGPTGSGARGAAPKVEVDVTDYGYRYAGIHPRGAEGNFIRTYHYVMPWTQSAPAAGTRGLSPAL